MFWNRSGGSRLASPRDPTYLERLIEEAEAIAELRDDRRDPPRRDAIRDRVVPAWSTS